MENSLAAAENSSTRGIWDYRISANSFRGNYSFLKFFVQRSQYISIKFPLHKPSENRGNYSREETIQGRKLFAEIRYVITFWFPTTLSPRSPSAKKHAYPMTSCKNSHLGFSRSIRSNFDQYWILRSTSKFCNCPRKTHFNIQCPVGGRGSDRRQRWYVNCLTLMSNRQMMATYHQIEIRWMALMADGVTNIC